MEPLFTILLLPQAIIIHTCLELFTIIACNSACVNSTLFCFGSIALETNFCVLAMTVAIVYVALSPPTHVIVRPPEEAGVAVA